MAKTSNTDISIRETQELLLSPAYQMQKNFEVQQRMAQMYVQSTIVPDIYKGNIGNCVIAIDMAQRMHANPLMVMQNLYIVHGNPAWSSKFLISCINMSGRFTPLRYQFYGKRGTEEYACRAYAYDKADKEHKDALCSVWITMSMAKNEGWLNKQGSKWLTMPDQMLAYRAAAFWSRIYAPEISMGFLTKEEADDYVDYEDVTNQASASPQDGEGDIPAPEIKDAPAYTVTTSEAAQETKSEAEATPQPVKENTEKPADAIAEAMKKQRKTNYKAPDNTTLFGGHEVNTETGEIKGN